MTRRPALPDDTARDEIVGERARNLVVIAGAGTGKTTMIVRRMVDMVAPAAGSAAAGSRPLEMQRLAAITFTRRAAGELRYRIREQLLAAIATCPPADATRRARLLDAISELDVAFIGTIHGFAERLLRLRPVEAHLSPDYTVAEDTTELVHETLERLRRGAEEGKLGERLGDHGARLAPADLDEATQVLLTYERAGLHIDHREGVFGPVPSLEALCTRFVETRDVEIEPPPAARRGLGAARAVLVTLREYAGDLDAEDAGSDEGSRWLARALDHLSRALRQGADQGDACRWLLRLRREGKDLRARRDFAGAPHRYEPCKILRGEAPGKRSGLPEDLGERLQRPFDWLTSRLVRLRPVVIAQYEQVKAEHGQVDQIDLLLKLRNLLRDRCDVRADFQALFDHLFIDEFQDTDPLQVEIAFFLGEDGAQARHWQDVTLRAGVLTLVGDPKQSIYRFRRADIATYQRAVQALRAQGAVEQRLVTNFRTRPELIEVLNRTLAELLGRDATQALDADRGRAVYEDLEASPFIAPDAAPAVHVVPYEDVPDGAGAGAGDAGGAGAGAGDADGADAAAGEIDGAVRGRELEAEALARYVRWLCAARPPVRVPGGGEGSSRRPLEPADIAVLAPTTTQVPLLLRQLDRLEVAYAARGGRLYLGHPVIRRTLLALRALADGDDGVAVAALLAPPFLAVDPADLAAARAVARRAGPGGTGGAPAGVDGAVPDLAARADRVADARRIVGALRRTRLERSPGATVRDLVERTGLGRRVVCGPNGGQILSGLYGLALELDRLAEERGLDFDAATAHLRAWAERPVYADAPEPIDRDAIQVLSIHQAKGLEFPVVILWDGWATLSRSTPAVWTIGRDGGSWSLHLEGLRLEHPRDGDLAGDERRHERHEARRLYYVAATRARDLLVLPLPRRALPAAQRRADRPYRRGAADLYVTHALVHEIGPELAHRVEQLAPYRPDHPPDWARVELSTGKRAAARGEARDEACGEARDEACGEVCRAGAVTDTEIDTRIERIEPRIEPDAALGARLDRAVDALRTAIIDAARPRAVPMAITAAARWREDRERGEPPAGEGARDGQPGEGAALEGAAVDGAALEGAVLEGAAVDGETQEHDAVWEPGRERTRKHEQSRHGPIFGEVVHRALELEIGGSCDTLEEATGRAVREHQLAPELHDEARRDIARTHAALAEQGLLAGTCLVEHPVVLEADGRLLAGIIDLLVVGEDEVVVIDYKTDRKRPGSARAAYPEYAAQLELYGEALARSGLLGERRLRLGLLLTERGQISWLEPPPG